MRTRYPVGAAAIVVSALISLAPSSKAVAYGPGRVVQTVNLFLATVDSGREGEISRLLESKGREGLCSFDAKGRFEKQNSGLVFYDISADGQSVKTEGVAAFVAQQMALGRDGENRWLRTRVRNIRAECPRGQEAYAVIEFDRRFLREGRKVSQSMRATVLLAMSGDDPDFRIFHWNAAPIGNPRFLATDDR